MSFSCKTQVEEVDSTGKVKVVHISDVKYMLPADSHIKLPDYQSFSQQSKLRIDPKNIPNLKWEPNVTINTNFATASSKLDSVTSVMNSLHSNPIVSTTTSYNLIP